MTVDNIQPKIKKTSEAKIKANARYTKKKHIKIAPFV